MMDVRLIAAVGRRGQLGLGGRLPWHDPEDLRWFREQTTGGVVLVGQRTFETLPTLRNRALVTWGGKTDPAHVIREVQLKFALQGATDVVIWIAGGAKTYAAFMPYVRRAVVTLIDYDGPADVWMPPLWGNRP